MNTVMKRLLALGLFFLLASAYAQSPEQLNPELRNPASVQEVTEVIAAFTAAFNSPKGRIKYPTEEARKSIFRDVMAFYADYLATHPYLPTK